MNNTLYAGNAYEFDNVDSRAELSKKSGRDAVAVRVMRSRRPFNFTTAQWDGLEGWAKSQASGESDTLPPSCVTAICACRWPGEPEENNGIRAERNAR